MEDWHAVASPLWLQGLLGGGGFARDLQAHESALESGLSLEKLDFTCAAAHLLKRPFAGASRSLDINFLGSLGSVGQHRHTIGADLDVASAHGQQMTFAAFAIAEHARLKQTEQERMLG